MLSHFISTSIYIENDISGESTCIEFCCEWHFMYMLSKCYLRTFPTTKTRMFIQYIHSYACFWLKEQCFQIYMSVKNIYLFSESHTTNVLLIHNY